MKRTRCHQALAVFMLFALGLSAIAWAPSEPDGAVALRNEQWVAGAVTGSRAGAFAYYTIDYPGDGSVVVIELRYAPADPVTRNGFGFNVYGPYGYLIGKGISVGDVGGDGVLQLKWSDRNPATWLVQVYNYLPDHSVAYGIMAKGIPAPKPTPAPPAPSRRGPPIPLIGAGTMTGRPGGTFVYYNVTVPAGGPDVQLIMNLWPDSAEIAGNVGFTAFGPSGQTHNGTATAVAGERKATLSAKAPGTYRVQVFNYIHNLTVQYTLRSEPAGQ